jgi:hypothetical protein
MKFQPNDLVICIREGHNFGTLKKGMLYTVETMVHPDEVRLKDQMPSSWFCSRFRIATKLETLFYEN